MRTYRHRIIIEISFVENAEEIITNSIISNAAETNKENCVVINCNNNIENNITNAKSAIVVNNSTHVLDYIEFDQTEENLLTQEATELIIETEYYDTICNM